MILGNSTNKAPREQYFTKLFGKIEIRKGKKQHQSQFPNMKRRKETYPLIETNSNSKICRHDLVGSLIDVCQRQIGYVTDKIEANISKEKEENISE